MTNKSCHRKVRSCKSEIVSPMKVSTNHDIQTYLTMKRITLQELTGHFFFIYYRVYKALDIRPSYIHTYSLYDRLLIELFPKKITNYVFWII